MEFAESVGAWGIGVGVETGQTERQGTSAALANVGCGTAAQDALFSLHFYVWKPILRRKAVLLTLRDYKKKPTINYINAELSVNPSKAAPPSNRPLKPALAFTWLPSPTLFHPSPSF